MFAQATSLLLSLVAFFCLILLLYHTSIGAFFLSARPGTLYNIQTIINTIQVLLHIVTILPVHHIVTYCYNFFLDFRVKSLLHTVTYCYNCVVGALCNGGDGTDDHDTTSMTSRVYANGCNDH
jgi:hypothetical protein